MARKKITILVNDEEYKHLAYLLEKDLDIKGVMEVVDVTLCSEGNKIELEINGMMTYDIWNKFCNELNLRAPYPGF